MAQLSDYTSPLCSTQCPECDNTAIWESLKNALVVMNFEPHEVMVVYGQGKSGNMCNCINTYGFHSRHGKAIPIAEGIKMANSSLPVIVILEGNDLHGEGLSHFIDACRRNPNMTVILNNDHSNTPATDSGQEGKVSPLEPLITAITVGSTFVARGFGGDPTYTMNLLIKAIKHTGFSFVDILQPSITDNQIQTSWYKERIYMLEDEIYTANDTIEAYKKALEWNTRIPLGIFYGNKRETYEEGLPQIKDKPLVEQGITNIDISRLYIEFM